ncbi:MAG: ferrous iron transport protein B, partial [Nitrospinota bacterium]
MFHCSSHSSERLDSEAVLLIGNPNVGKSVIFSHLTGKYVTVSNYPGTTVEFAQGSMTFSSIRAAIVDTPGVNNLIPLSEDERVTRDMLLHSEGHRIVQVADSKNLRRALLISLQLAEMELPFSIALNMTDEARSRGISVDEKRLAEILGVEVVPTVATRRQGIERLKRSISSQRPSSFRFRYPQAIEKGIEALLPLLAEAPISPRSLALMILAGDESLRDWLRSHHSQEVLRRMEEVREEVQRQFRRPLSYIMNEARLRVVDGITGQVIQGEELARAGLGYRLGSLAMHPVWGVGILLLVLYFIYKFVGEFAAGTLVDLLEGGLFAGYLNPWAERVVEFLIPIPLIRDLLVGQYGLISVGLTYAVAIILPIVGAFFLVFGVLEDTGYLPRLAIMVNRLFKVIGLNGKAVLPMVLGLGCDTMATLTTRILDTKKERLLVTLLLALGVPCSAQLGVVLGMLGATSLTAAVIWALVVGLTILLVGFLASRVLPGEGSDFVLEIPPMRVPQVSNILIKTAARVEWYLREAVPLFLLGTLVLFILDRVRLLGVLERVASPLVEGLLGLPARATDAFIVGFLRRDYGAAGLFSMAQ